MKTWCGAIAEPTDTWSHMFKELTGDRESIYSCTYDIYQTENDLSSYRIAYKSHNYTYSFYLISKASVGVTRYLTWNVNIDQVQELVRDTANGGIAYIKFYVVRNVDKYEAGLVTGPSKLLLSEQVLGQDVNIDVKTGKLAIKTPTISWNDITNKPDISTSGGTSLETTQFNWDLNIPVSSADLSYGGYTFTIPNITEFQTFIESFGHTFGNPLVYFYFSGSINNNAIMTIMSSSFYNSNIGVCSIGSLINEFKNSDKLCTYDAHPSFFYQKDSGLIFQIDEYSIYKDTSKTTPSVSVIKTPITQLQGSLSILVIK